jgi:hypothetical protein
MAPEFFQCYWKFSDWFFNRERMPMPPRECKEVLSWMRDGYLDALYDLQKPQ